MRQSLQKYLSFGIGPDTPARKANYIRTANAVAVQVAVWLLCLDLACGWYFISKSPDLVFANLGAIAIFLSVPLLSRARRYRPAQVVIAVNSFAIVTFNALHFGRDSWNHLFLLAAIVIAFQYFDDISLLALVSAVGVALFAGVEIWYATGHGVLMMHPVAPIVYKIAKYASIYNIIVLTVFISFLTRRNLNRTERALDTALARADTLLLNILPASIAKRLKAGEKKISDSFPAASVIFADIVGFTAMSKAMSSEQVVSMLDDLFRRIDAEAQRIGIEKIKTIGDCYMAAAGIPEACEDHADRAVALGRAIQKCISEHNAAHRTSLQVRIGINSGPIVAGIIGHHKYIYDLWGDAVNTASRMESHGVPGAIMISDDTKNALKRSIPLRSAGLKEIKGKGRMQTWLVGK